MEQNETKFFTWQTPEDGILEVLEEGTINELIHFIQRIDSQFLEHYVKRHQVERYRNIRGETENSSFIYKG